MARAVKKYHHGNLRKALMDEALRRLNDNSEGDLSLRELAKACGVTANAPYRHFKSKDALLSALAAHGFVLLASSLSLSGGDGPVKQFRDFAQLFGEFCSSHPALFRLMFFSVPVAAPDLDEARKRCFQQLCESVRILMGKLTEDADVKREAVVAWGLLSGYCLLTLDGRFPHSELIEPLAARDVARDLARGIRGKG